MARHLRAGSAAPPVHGAEAAARRRHVRAPRRHGAPGSTQRGVTLVELLVGAAVGLTVAAAAGTAVVGSLRENQALLVEARLTEELHAAVDLMARDLRRAGYWAGAASGVWGRGDSHVAANPYTGLATSPAVTDAVRFNVAAESAEDGVVDAAEEHGFRLRGGAIESQLGHANWQALTDSGTLVIDRFGVTPSVEEVVLDDYCSQACPVGSPTCAPRQQVRSVVVALDAHAAADTRIVRTVRETVRLRNDVIVGACPP